MGSGTKMSVNTKLTEGLTFRQQMKVSRWRRGDTSFSNHVFQGAHTIFIPLKHEPSPHEKPIARHLKKHGFEVHDYLGGIAKDKHGRDVKIGKILAKSGNQKLLQKFSTDPARAQKKALDGYRVAITRHPHHVAGMTSEDHPWADASCMNIGSGCNRRYLPKEVRHGTHVAYLIKHDDEAIRKPVARLALKHYHPTSPLFKSRTKGNRILVPEPRIYGNAPSSFHKTVSDWASSNFKPDKGKLYKIHKSVYSDDYQKVMAHDSGSANKIINHFIKNPYNKFNMSHWGLLQHASKAKVAKALFGPHEDLKVAALKFAKNLPSNYGSATPRYDHAHDLVAGNRHAPFKQVYDSTIKSGHIATFGPHVKKVVMKILRDSKAGKLHHSRDDFVFKAGQVAGGHPDLVNKFMRGNHSAMKGVASTATSLTPSHVRKLSKAGIFSHFNNIHKLSDDTAKEAVKQAAKREPHRLLWAAARDQSRVKEGREPLVSKHHMAKLVKAIGGVNQHVSGNDLYHLSKHPNMSKKLFNTLVKAFPHAVAEFADSMSPHHVRAAYHAMVEHPSFHADMHNAQTYRTKGNLIMNSIRSILRSKNVSKHIVDHAEKHLVPAHPFLFRSEVQFARGSLERNAKAKRADRAFKKNMEARRLVHQQANNQ